MRPMIRMFVLAVATLSASAAFAFDKVTVNVPFNFESRGKVYPAGQYDVKLDVSRNVLTLSSKTDTKSSLMWSVTPAEFGPDAPTLSMKFDDNGDGNHALRSIRLATRTTPVLDVRERHSAQREVSITGGR
jgi:hypothetical protein